MRPRRLEGAIYRELSDGTTMVLKPDGSSAQVLNVTAAVVWDLSDGTHDVEAIAAFIASEVAGAPLERVREDVLALLAELLANGLIEDLDTCGPPPSPR